MVVCARAQKHCPEHLIFRAKRVDYPFDFERRFPRGKIEIRFAPFRHVEQIRNRLHADFFKHGGAVFKSIGNVTTHKISRLFCDFRISRRVDKVFGQAFRLDFDKPCAESVFVDKFRRIFKRAISFSWNFLPSAKKLSPSSFCAKSVMPTLTLLPLTSAHSCDSRYFKFCLISIIYSCYFCLL